MFKQIYIQGRNPIYTIVFELPQNAYLSGVKVQSDNQPKSSASVEASIITASDPTARLREACRNVNQHDSAYQEWPEAQYDVATNFNLMICPLKGVKAQFWKDFFKIMKKEGKKKGNIKRIKGDTLAFSDENVRLFQLVVQSINPYTWLLYGYIERSFIGADICGEASLQRFLDKVISGVKLRHNQGLVYTPMVPYCRPCDVNVHSVVRYENFQLDVTSLLSSLELDNFKSQLIGTDEGSKISDDVTELTLQAARHFRGRECSNITDFGVRIMEVYKLKGYVIPDKLKKYLTELKNLHMSSLKSFIPKIARGVTLAPADVKRRVQHEAYSSVRKETIQYIQSIYKFDFEAFAYNDFP